MTNEELLTENRKLLELVQFYSALYDASEEALRVAISTAQMATEGLKVAMGALAVMKRRICDDECYYTETCSEVIDDALEKIRGLRS